MSVRSQGGVEKEEKGQLPSCGGGEEPHGWLCGCGGRVRMENDV